MNCCVPLGVAIYVKLFLFIEMDSKNKMNTQVQRSSMKWLNDKSISVHSRKYFTLRIGGDSKRNRFNLLWIVMGGRIWIDTEIRRDIKILSVLKQILGLVAEISTQICGAN